MLALNAVQIFDEDTFKKLDEQERDIDDKLKKNKGNIAIAVKNEDNIAHVAFWNEIARRYTKAGWIVARRRTSVQETITIMHPIYDGEASLGAE